MLDIILFGRFRFEFPPALAVGSVFSHSISELNHFACSLLALVSAESILLLDPPPFRIRCGLTFRGEVLGRATPIGGNVDEIALAAFSAVLSSVPF